MMTVKRIGIALAFSPTAEAMLTETARLKRLFVADLVIIHVGVHTLQEENTLKNLLEKAGLSEDPVNIIWKEGDPAGIILKVCQEESIDLLVAGALKRENIVKFYIGTIARKIMRKAHCSLMIITNPSSVPASLKTIIVNAEDSPHVEQAIQIGCYIGQAQEQASIHIVRELKLLGLAMAATSQHSEQEYNDLQQHLLQDEINEVEKMLLYIPHDHININIKVLSGKSGFELCRFSERKQADLLIVGAPPRRFSWFDLLFPHDLEYVFADLPCNLLIVNPEKARQ